MHYAWKTCLAWYVTRCAFAPHLLATCACLSSKLRRAPSLTCWRRPDEPHAPTTTAATTTPTPTLPRPPRDTRCAPPPPRCTGALCMHDNAIGCCRDQPAAQAPLLHELPVALREPSLCVAQWVDARSCGVLFMETYPSFPCFAQYSCNCPGVAMSAATHLAGYEGSSKKASAFRRTSFGLGLKDAFAAMPHNDLALLWPGLRWCMAGGVLDAPSHFEGRRAGARRGRHHRATTDSAAQLQVPVNHIPIEVLAPLATL